MYMNASATLCLLCLVATCVLVPDRLCAVVPGGLQQYYLCLVSAFVGCLGDMCMQTVGNIMLSCEMKYWTNTPLAE